MNSEDKARLAAIQEMLDKAGPRGNADVDPEVFAKPERIGFTAKMREIAMSATKVNVSNKRRQAPLPDGYTLDRNSDTLLVIGTECVPAHYDDLSSVLVMQDDGSVLPALDVAHRHGVLVRCNVRRSQQIQLDAPVLNIEWHDELDLSQFIEGTHFYATDEYIIDIIAQRFKTSLVVVNGRHNAIYDVTFNRKIKPVIDCKSIVIGDYEYLNDIDGREGAYIYDSICEGDETTRCIADVSEIDNIPTRASVNVYVSSDTLNMREVFNLLKLPKLRNAVIFYYDPAENAQYRLAL